MSDITDVIITRREKENPRSPEEYFKINDLPEEILYEIFLCFDFKELKHIIALVCKKWYEITCSKTFGIPIKIGWHRVQNTSKILKRIEKTQYRIRALILWNIFDDDPLIDALTNVNLNSVEFVHLRYSSIATESIYNMIEKCKCLKYVELNDCFPSVVRVLQILCKKTFLKSIDFTEMSLDNFSNFFPLINMCKYLSEVTIVLSVPFPNENFSEFLNPLKDNLTLLRINCKYFEENEYLQIAKCKKLRVLILYNSSSLNTNALLKFGELENLQVISISCTDNVSKIGWKTCFNGVSFPRLKVIHFFESDELVHDYFTDIIRDSLVYEVKHLSKVEYLEKLDINDLIDA